MIEADLLEMENMIDATLEFPEIGRERGNLGAS